jgi:hypothetical protein
MIDAIHLLSVFRSVFLFQENPLFALLTDSILPDLARPQKP